MTLPIKGKSEGNPVDAADVAIRRGAKLPDQLKRYARSLWDACQLLGIRADVAFSQADVETGSRDTGVGFQSNRWTREGNPAGMGIETGMSDAKAGKTYTPEQWGIIHATHLAGYAGIQPPAEWKALDFRWQNMIDAGYFGVAKTVHDLDERWAQDPGNYGDKIVARHRIYAFSKQPTYVGDPSEIQPMPAANKHTYVLSAGHRNFHKGGANGEYDWTPWATKIFAEELRKVGATVYIVQEHDGDSDATFTHGGLQMIGRHVVAIDKRYGPITAFISMHYNGGGSRGYHGIFPDSAGLSPYHPDDVKSANPLDVQAARNIAARIKATKTVPMLSWTADRPGVMSERETGVGADGWRLSELAESRPVRGHAVRLIVEAGSIDTADRAYIQNPAWVRDVYSRAMIDGLRDTFGAFPKENPTNVDDNPTVQTPAPTKPTKPASVYAMPIKRAWAEELRQKHLPFIKLKDANHPAGEVTWYFVERMYVTLEDVNRQQVATDSSRFLNEPVPAGTPIMIDAVGENHAGKPYGLSPWETMFDLSKLKPLSWPQTRDQ